MISCPTPLPDDAKMTEVALSRKRHFADAADLGWRLQIIVIPAQAGIHILRG